MEPSMTPARGLMLRLFRLFTVHRLALWGTGLLVLSWGIYIHTIAVPGYIDRAGRFKGSDFTQFYVSGSLVLEGRTESLYDPTAHLAEGRRRIYPGLTLYATNPNYGPQTALLFVPLAMLPFTQALTIFLCLLTVAYAAAVWLIWRECPGLQPHGWLVALLAAASPLFFTTLRYAQLSTFTLLVCALALVAFRRQRRFTAGLLVGCLSFKPQLGIVIGAALLFAREWRVVAGAVTTTAVQLAIASVVSGWSTLAAYFGVLWRLLLDPTLVQLYPSELHSLRGLFQLLIPVPAIVTALSTAGLALLLVAGVRMWSRRAPVSLRWGSTLLVTALASPHFLSYDLILLTLTIMVFADWGVRATTHPMRAAVSVLLPVVYLAPFSSNLARLTNVQLSVIGMSALAWCCYHVLMAADVTDALDEK